MDVEDHVAGNVHDGGIWVRGGVVEEPDYFVVSLLSGFGLGGCNGAESDEHGRVDGHGIVEESTGDFLDKVCLFFRK